MNRWNLNGGVLKDARVKAGVSIEFIAKWMNEEPRVVLGVEKGYRAFKTHLEARSFYQRYVGVVARVLKSRLNEATAAKEFQEFTDRLENVRPPAARQQKENVG